MLQKQLNEREMYHLNIQNYRIMANWASTSYAIEGGKEELNKLYELIDGFMKHKLEPVAEKASNSWEGNIVKSLGATEEQMNQNYLRGFIEDYDLCDNVLCIHAEEAWGASDFRHVLRQLMPNLNIYFIVEEPGCEVYATNDENGKYFSDRYYVDAYVNGNYESDYFKTEERAMAYVATLLGMESVSKNELESWNKDHEDGDDFIYIHEFEIVDC